MTTLNGGFDNLQVADFYRLAEAARRGRVHVLLWSDELFESQEHRAPRFPQAERQYFIESIRYVDQVSVISRVDERPPFVARDDANAPAVAGRKKVIITGCYDWLHSGHVRFFEEVSQLGDVYAVVGHDRNIALLKGPGHPQFPQEARRFMVGSVRYVKQALISTGNGWLDAAPEIEQVQPHYYAVNEDGDKPEKRDYCRDHGIEYVVLKRLPRPGLPARNSTALRGY